MKYLVFCFALLMFNSCFIGSSNGSECTDDIECASNYCDPDDFTCKTDPCDGISCGSNGYCKVDSWDKPYCDCDYGYVQDENNYICNLINYATCTEDDTRLGTKRCGINNRGYKQEFCSRGSWITANNCVDSDRCIDNDLQWDNCSYGMGYRNRLCELGQWSNWSSCTTECTEYDTRTLVGVCGSNGYGNQDQICSGGVWVDSGSCVDGDECRDGDVDYSVCNNGVDYQERYCSNGTWSGWGECYSKCYDGDVRILNCGVNGTGDQYQTCSDGTWYDDGICDDPDECVNGEVGTNDCGDGSYQDTLCQNGYWYATTECY